MLAARAFASPAAADSHPEHCDTIDYDDIHVQVLRELGEGCYAKVFSVNLLLHSQPYYAVLDGHHRPSHTAALKVFNPPSSPLDEEAIRHEIDISLTLSRLASPSTPIVRTLLSRTFALDNAPLTPGHVSTIPCTFMDLCEGGNLRDFLHDRLAKVEEEIQPIADGHGLLGEAEAALFFRPLAEGLRFCHSNRVLHLDVKPENVLLREPGRLETACLSDFGLAMRIPSDRPTETMASLAEDAVRAAPGIGTEAFMAPEVAYGGYYSPLADVWSLGAVLLEALTGCTLNWQSFQGWRGLGSSYTEMVIESKDRCVWGKWASLSETARDVTKGMLCPDPLRRLNLQDVLLHPWLTSHLPPSSL